MEARKILGWNLRAIRASRGQTIEELAGVAQLDSSSVARIERGTANPTLEVIERLSHALDVPVVQLFLEPADRTSAPKPLPAGRKPRR